ncbi:hypothetical protein FRC02_006380 [Tulasnella sp. 418]|nr:hypothetical protein FRC02_006380 [Tulasnella sp. 418]
MGSSFSRRSEGKVIDSSLFDVFLTRAAHLDGSSTAGSVQSPKNEEKKEEVDLEVANDGFLWWLSGSWSTDDSSSTKALNDPIREKKERVKEYEVGTEALTEMLGIDPDTSNFQSEGDFDPNGPISTSSGDGQTILGRDWTDMFGLDGNSGYSGSSGMDEDSSASGGGSGGGVPPEGEPNVEVSSPIEDRGWSGSCCTCFDGSGDSSSCDGGGCSCD